MKKVVIAFLISIFVVPFAFGQRELIHALPSKLGFDATYLNQKVDSIMQMGIDSLAFPGAQLLVAKNDTVIFHKAYGFHTYDREQPVATNDLYDLASVTKITGPLPALMKLVDEGNLDLDAPFSTYWTPWQHVKNKKDLTLRQILAHQAGLVPYIVFLQKAMRKNGTVKKRFLRHEQHRKFQKQAYTDLFVNAHFERKWTASSIVQKYRKRKNTCTQDLLFSFFRG